MSYDSFAPVIKNDLIGLLLGEQIGKGVGRKVYLNRLDPTTVIKIEEGSQSFQNTMEWQLWEHVSYDKTLSRWFAPCVDISACGTVLIMKRTEPAQERQFPKKMPAFLCDFKRTNYGMLNGRLVAHDYGLPTAVFDRGMTKRMRVAHWWNLGDE
jgi:hypothetical protein